MMNFYKIAALLIIATYAQLCSAASLNEKTDRSYVNRECGIKFDYPAGFRVQRLKKIDRDEEFWKKSGLCRFRVAREFWKNAEDPVITLHVVLAPLIKAMENDSNWWRADEADDTEWVRQGYGMGRGQITKMRDLTMIGASYSINCGGSRAPGEAISCDAFAGGVSNGTVTVLLDSLGEDEVALKLLNSLRLTRSLNFSLHTDPQAGQ